MVEELFSNLSKPSKKENSTPPKLVFARSKTISSILAEGLQSSALLMQKSEEYFGSIDRRPNEEVHGRNFIPHNQCPDKSAQNKKLTKDWYYQRFFEIGLYDGDNSILPVIAERPGEGSEDRSQMSYTEEGRIQLRERLFASILLGFPATIGDKISYTHIVRPTNELTADQISYVLMPEAVYTDYFADTTHTKDIPIIVVRDTITRSIRGGTPIEVPDYET